MTLALNSMAHENINVRELPPEGASVITDREEYNEESNVLVSQHRYNTLVRMHMCVKLGIT